MTLDQAIAFATLFLALVFFAWGKWRYDLVAGGALVLVTATGLIDKSQALSGFGHPAVITVAAVLVISRALNRSGVVAIIARHIQRYTESTFMHIVVLSTTVAVLSAFMNNVGAIAILLPVALATCRERDRSPAIVLMPLAFGSILGGLMTMIGTPPNIIIATYRAEITGEPFGMFDFSPVGVPIALVGLLFVALIGWRLIPRERQGKRPAEELFQIDEYVTEVRVGEGSHLVGKSLGAAESTTGDDVSIIGVAHGDTKLRKPVPWDTVQQGDILLLRADPTLLKPAMDDHGLELMQLEGDVRDEFAKENTKLMEAVVMPGSTLEDRSPHFLKWRSGYALELLAVGREGEPIRKRIRRVLFRPGDVVLMQADEEVEPEILSDLGLLPLPERGLSLGEPRRALLSVLIFAAAITASATGFLPIAVAFLAAIGVYVVLDILPLRELYKPIDWPIIVLLGAMIPVGQALEQTGGTALIAETIVSLTATFPAWALLAIVMVITMTLSDLINNAATALVMAPIGVAIATATGASPDPFLMTIAIGASCAFLTPIGHQSNTLVMGPAGYHFGDYWRVGLPLEIAIVVISIPLILIVWPL